MYRIILLSVFVSFVTLAAIHSWAHVESVLAFLRFHEMSGHSVASVLGKFDDHPARFRTVSQVAEFINAIAHPRLIPIVGANPFFTSPSAVLSAIVSPLLLWGICRRMEVSRLLAAAIVAFCVLSIGFLSAHLIYFRPAKHLVILFFLATTDGLAIYSQTRSASAFRWAVACAALGAASDEVGLAIWIIPTAAFYEAARAGAYEHRRFVVWAVAVLLSILAAIKLHMLASPPRFQPNDIAGKDWPALWADVLDLSIVERLLQFAGGPVCYLSPLVAGVLLLAVTWHSRLTLAVVAVVAWTVLLSYIGGGGVMPYVEGFYYGSFMPALWAVVLAIRKPWRTFELSAAFVFLCLAIISTLRFPVVNEINLSFSAQLPNAEELGRFNAAK